MKELTVSEKVQAEATKAVSAAEEAIVAADAQALFNQVKKSEQGRIELARALDGVLSVYASDSTRRPTELLQPTDSAVNAMRDVALACVELAKAVIAQK